MRWEHVQQDMLASTHFYPVSGPLVLSQQVLELPSAINEGEERGLNQSRAAKRGKEWMDNSQPRLSSEQHPRSSGFVSSLFGIVGRRRHRYWCTIELPLLHLL